MLGRLIVLDKGVDTGTANLTFVIILGVCIIAYLIILATLAHIIVPWIKKQDVVLWLQTVFFDLRELEFSYIKGKLYDGQTEKYIIPNIDNIPKYLAEQNK
jgi:hypothetical protein